METSILPNKRDTDHVVNQRAEREKYDRKRTPDSKKRGVYRLKGIPVKRRRELAG